MKLCIFEVFEQLLHSNAFLDADMAIRYQTPLPTSPDAVQADFRKEKSPTKMAVDQGYIDGIVADLQYHQDRLDGESLSSQMKNEQNNHKDVKLRTQFLNRMRMVVVIDLTLNNTDTDT